MFTHYITSVAVGDEISGQDDNGQQLEGTVTAIEAEDSGAKLVQVNGAWHRFASTLTLVGWTPAAGSSYEDNGA